MNSTDSAFVAKSKFNIPECRNFLEAGKNFQANFLEKEDRWVLTRSGNITMIDFNNSTQLRNQFANLRDRTGSAPYIVFVGDSTQRGRTSALINLISKAGVKGVPYSIAKGTQFQTVVVKDKDDKDLVVVEYIKNVELDTPFEVIKD